MLSERMQKCFEDIRSAIALIRAWVAEAGGPEKATVHDTLVRSGIELKLLTISEAAIRLHKLDPDAAPRLAPSIDWAGIRGIGNFIRHKYDDLDTQVIIDVLAGRLDELDAAAETAIRTLAQTSAAS